jgi:hypothetical protein
MAKRLMLLAAIVVLMAPISAKAGALQDRIAGLLGIDSAPATDKAFAAAPYAESVPPANFTLWLLGNPGGIDNPDVELTGRLGWRDGDTEFGAQFDALGIHGENYERWGMFAILHLEGDPTSLIGQPYIGYAASIISDYTAYGPFAGTKYNKVFVLEVRYQNFSGKLDKIMTESTDELVGYAGIVMEY